MPKSYEFCVFYRFQTDGVPEKVADIPMTSTFITKDDYKSNKLLIREVNEILSECEPLVIILINSILISLLIVTY